MNTKKEKKQQNTIKFKEAVDGMYSIEPGSASSYRNFTRVTLSLPFPLDMPRTNVENATYDQLKDLYGNVFCRSKKEINRGFKNPEVRCFGAIYRLSSQTGWSVELHLKDFNYAELRDYLAALPLTISR